MHLIKLIVRWNIVHLYFFLGSAPHDKFTKVVGDITTAEYLIYYFFEPIPMTIPSVPVALFLFILSIVHQTFLYPLDSIIFLMHV